MPPTTPPISGATSNGAANTGIEIDETNDTIAIDEVGVTGADMVAGVVATKDVDVVTFEAGNEKLTN